MKKQNIKPTANGGTIGKLCIKTITIEYFTKKNKEINNRYNKLIQDINDEKLKPHPDYKKIEQNQIELEDIDDYKTNGAVIRSKEKIILTVIRSKEKIILNEEKPTKYFFLQEKQKQIKKKHKITKKQTRKNSNNKF